MSTPDAPNLTEFGNLDRFITRYGDEILFCPKTGRWLVWDGKRWAEDERHRVLARARTTIKAFSKEAKKKLAEVETLPVEFQDNARAMAKQLLKWAHTSESRHHLESIVKQAESVESILVAPNELDVNPWLLTVMNGTLDLRTGQLKPFNRADRITQMAGAKYIETAQCPTFMKFLDRILEGNAELIDFLQRAFGYALTGSMREQCLFLPFGDGENGKSTLLDIILAVLGDYGKTTPPETLLIRKGDGPRNDVARLKGARFVSSVDPESGKSLAEALVKQITGGDKIAARYLFEEFFEFYPTHKIFLAVNDKPIIKSSKHAIWRRIHPVHFPVTITQAEKDAAKEFTAQLHAELEGVLAWAVRGCLLWQEHGLKPPKPVTDSKESYQAEMDSFAPWFKETCTLDVSSKVLGSDLYTSYAAWCLDEGRFAANLQVFRDRLTTLGLKRTRIHGVTHWRGVKLTPATESEQVAVGCSGSSVSTLEKSEKSDVSL